MYHFNQSRFILEPMLSPYIHDGLSVPRENQVWARATRLSKSIYFNRTKRQPGPIGLIPRTDS